VTEPLETDAATGNPVVNNVGDPFDPPVEVFRSHRIITCKFFRSPAASTGPPATPSSTRSTATP
jgi:hypothetical protein